MCSVVKKTSHAVQKYFKHLRMVQKSPKSTGLHMMETTSWHNVAAKRKDRGSKNNNKTKHKTTRNSQFMHTKTH